MAGSTLTDKYRPPNLPIYYQYRKMKPDAFFVGLFGATAVLGVLMKIWKDFPEFLGGDAMRLALYKVMMPVGFIGEAIVFIIMGFMKTDDYIEVFPDEDELSRSQDHDDGHSDGVIVNMELPESLRELIEEKVAQQLDGKLEGLTNLLVEDVEKTRNLLTDTNEINIHIQDVAKSLATLAEKIQSAGESLSEFEKVTSSNLSANANSVSERLNSTNGELQVFEEEMKKLATRFKNFNSVAN